MLRVRTSPDIKLRAEVAAAAAGLTLTAWVEQLLTTAAPPVPETLDGSPPVKRRGPRQRPTPYRVASEEELSMTG